MPQRSGSTERHLGHECEWGAAGAEPEWKMSLQNHIISVTLTGRDSRPPSHLNKQHQCFLWQHNRITKADGGVRLLLLARPSSLCFLSKCRVGLGSFKVPADKWTTINHQLIHPSIPVVKGHWVKGWNLQVGQNTHFSLSAYSWDLLWLVKILNCWATQRFLWKTSWKEEDFC